MAGFLEFENAEQRLDRLQNTLERLNDTTVSTTTPSTNSTKPHFIPPPDDLLSRVRAFLPALEASNALLSSQDPTRINIEHINSDSGPYIEMNLGMGLFDVQGSTSTAANLPVAPAYSISKSSSISSESPTTTATYSYSSDDWDSDEDSDAGGIASFKSVRSIKPLPRCAKQQIQTRVRPSIVLLGEKSAESDCSARDREEG